MPRVTIQPELRLAGGAHGEKDHWVDLRWFPDRQARQCSRRLGKRPLTFPQLHLPTPGSRGSRGPRNAHPRTCARARPHAVSITLDTTSAVVSGPAGNLTLDVHESDADGNSEEKAALIGTALFKKHEPYEKGREAPTGTPTNLYC